MVPDDVELVRADVGRLPGVAEAFSAEFYATLFDLAPDLRRLFPTDLAEQRTKLFAELAVLVDRVLSVDGPDQLAAFERRAGELGERHGDYGVTGDMYPVVGRALLGALHETVPGFDERHVAAWERVYRTVADAMTA